MLIVHNSVSSFHLKTLSSSQASGILTMSERGPPRVKNKVTNLDIPLLDRMLIDRSPLPPSKSLQNNSSEKPTKDKMPPPSVPNTPSSIMKNSKNTKVVKEKTLKTKFDGIDCVWGNGSDTRPGN